ncbi:hypothetical protein, partial [Xanthomonas fragariae]|uniref:hypothetical protein n=1 Tax=Xanthomonas fragariae TaxID=48664 RepID=UPI001F43DA7B
MADAHCTAACLAAALRDRCSRAPSLSAHAVIPTFVAALSTEFFQCDLDLGDRLSIESPHPAPAQVWPTPLRLVAARRQDAAI